MNHTRPKAVPFFLASGTGQRFCVFHPHAGASCRGAVLMVPPFGEEMNKGRRVAALLARQLASQGFAILQVDLYGCGDSEGELRDARWADWHADLALGATWLATAAPAPLHLLGVRLGALLALDFARARRCGVAGMVLIQPLLSGAAWLNQLLRLKLANAILGTDEGHSPGGAHLRAALARGETLEIAGYDISSALAADLAGIDAAQLAPTEIPVTWLELASGPDRPLSPAAARISTWWREQGTRIDTRVLACPPFWTSQEIEDCPALVACVGEQMERVCA